MNNGQSLLETAKDMRVSSPISDIGQVKQS